MTCPTCAERRAAIMKAWQEKQIAEAVRQMALGAGEIVGIKEKSDGK